MSTEMISTRNDGVCNVQEKGACVSGEWGSEGFGQRDDHLEGLNSNFGQRNRLKKKNGCTQLAATFLFVEVRTPFPPDPPTQSPRSPDQVRWRGVIISRGYFPLLSVATFPPFLTSTSAFASASASVPVSPSPSPSRWRSAAAAIVHAGFAHRTKTRQMALTSTCSPSPSVNSAPSAPSQV